MVSVSKTHVILIFFSFFILFLFFYLFYCFFNYSCIAFIWNLFLFNIYVFIYDISIQSNSINRGCCQMSCLWGWKPEHSHGHQQHGHLFCTSGCDFLLLFKCLINVETICVALKDKQWFCSDIWSISLCVKSVWCGMRLHVAKIVRR